MIATATRIAGFFTALSLTLSAAGNDWMTSLNGDLPLSQITIPGTHDSGALLEPFPGTARTQSLLISEQLDIGVRFLDIRCRHEFDMFTIYHGFVPQGITFTEVLNFTFAFLEANPGETVIMSVKEEHTPQNNTRSFEDTFDSYVAQNPDGWRLAADTPTLDQARGKVVLFRRFGASRLPKGIDASVFPDNTTFSIGGRLRVQDRYVVTDNNDKWAAIHSLLGEAKYGAPGMLYVNFCSGYTPEQFGVPNITVVSDDINQRVTDFFTANTSGHYGTLLLDFADETKVRLIYNTNRPPGRPAHQPAYFTIVNRNSGKAIDLIAGNTGNGAQINQWNHDSGPNQRWALAPTENSDHFRLSSWISGKCASIGSNSTAAGSKLLSFDYADSGTNPAQHFDLVDAGDGYYQIRNVNSGLVLEIEGAATGDGARIQQNVSTGAAHQHWRLQPWGDYFLRASTEKYVSIAGGGNNHGDTIVQNAWFEEAAWMWRFGTASNGHLRTASLNALPRVISIPGALVSPGTAAQLEDYAASNSGSQELRIIPQTDGLFRFRFAHSDLSWEIPGGQTADLVGLEQNTPSADPWQEFQLERVVRLPPLKLPHPAILVQSGDVTLTWQSQVGYDYQTVWSANLADWENLDSEPVPGNGLPFTAVDVVNADRRFYKIAITEQPYP